MKLYQGRGILSDTKGKGISGGFSNVYVKGKHVSKCIKELRVSERVYKGLK